MSDTRDDIIDDSFFDELLRSYEGDLYLPDPEDFGIFINPDEVSSPPSIPSSGSSPHLDPVLSAHEVPDLVFDCGSNSLDPRPSVNPKEPDLLKRIEYLEEELQKSAYHISAIEKYIGDLRPYLIKVTTMIHELVSWRYLGNSAA